MAGLAQAPTGAGSSPIDLEVLTPPALTAVNRAPPRAFVGALTFTRANTGSESDKRLFESDQLDTVTGAPLESRRVYVDSQLRSKSSAPSMLKVTGAAFPLLSVVVSGPMLLVSQAANKNASDSRAHKFLKEEGKVMCLRVGLTGQDVVNNRSFHPALQLFLHHLLTSTNCVKVFLRE